MRRILLLLALAACSEAAAPPGQAPVRRLELRAELVQPDTVARGRRMLTTLTQASTPVVGQLVHFEVVEGQGTLFTAAEVTDAAGQVRSVWTLGTRAGLQVLRSYYVDQATGEPVSVLDSVQALPDTVASVVVDTAPVLLLAGERFALSGRVGRATDRYGNAAGAGSVRYSIPAPWQSSADTVWAAAPAQGAVAVAAGSASATIPVRALIRQLVGSYDAGFSCAYTSRMAGRAGLRDSMVFSMRVDSVAYRVTAQQDGRVYLRGDVRHLWSDGLVEYETGKVLAVPIRAEAPDTVHWGTSYLDLGAAARAEGRWSGGNFCGAMYFAPENEVWAGEAVLVER